jgi:hypothetical protein
MRLPRFRFTIGQLVILVALSAVVFATLPMPLWPVIVAIGLVLAGFAIDRTRGGPGIYGAMIAGGMGFPLIALLAYVSLYVVFGGRPIALPELVVMICAAGIFGGAWGAILGYWTFMLARFFRSVARRNSLADRPLRSLIGRAFRARPFSHPQPGEPRP